MCLLSVQSPSLFCRHTPALCIKFDTKPGKMECINKVQSVPLFCPTHRRRRNFSFSFISLYHFKPLIFTSVFSEDQTNMAEQYNLYQQLTSRGSSCVLARYSLLQAESRWLRKALTKRKNRGFCVSFFMSLAIHGKSRTQK